MLIAFFSKLRIEQGSSHGKGLDDTHGAYIQHSVHRYG
jgi:hypothetical protein